MTKTHSQFRSIVKTLASLKLAVVILTILSILIAVGTIVESLYDAQAAKKLVYDTVWMYAAMSALSLSLIAVMVDRWPWKPRHAAFVFAHIGILILLLGSVMTMKLGLDGSMAVDIGRNNRFVTVNETDILIYASFDGSRMTKLYEQEVDFFRKSPADKALSFKIDAGEVRITDYHKYVLPSRQVKASDETGAGSGLRFQIQNDRVNVVEWLVQRKPGVVATHDFGPAKIHLGPAPNMSNGLNEIFLTPLMNGQIQYTIFSNAHVKALKTGKVEEGGVFETGWMGLQVRVLRFFPHAEEKWDFQVKDRPTPLTTSAVKIIFNQKEHWLLLNDTVRLFSQNAAYYVSYVNRRIDLGFPLTLKDFAMIPYPGTQRARAYRSLVQLPEVEHAEISMNEPLKYKGLTFYQASFQQAPGGKPTASIFSVNQDPGRWMKYFGSFLISLGIVLLFYFKRKAKKVQ